MAGELSEKDIEKLNKKIEESLKKIVKMGNKNQELLELKQEHFGKGLNTIKGAKELSDKIQIFNNLNKAALTRLSELRVNERHTSDPENKKLIQKQIKQYEYIQAVASSIKNKEQQLRWKNVLKPETKRTPYETKQFKNAGNERTTKAEIEKTKKNEQKLNKTIRNFEIKDDPVKYAKEAGKSLRQKLANIVPSRKKAAGNKDHGIG
ncbi:MAG: hypothetical protein EKK61_02020 [Rickettsiales bacterium]|nr:MAG: hypothetical protein EKK61_02020 [Rickettsiales bacterium]